MPGMNVDGIILQFAAAGDDPTPGNVATLTHRTDEGPCPIMTTAFVLCMFHPSR